MQNKDNWIIFGLSNSCEYAQKIAKNLNIECGEILTSKFADGEILVKAKQTVRGKDVLLVQSTSFPVNDNLMELLIAIDALKRASSNSITVIIPYYGYARQDRKSKGREPITCKLVASFLETAGASKVVLIDIHSEQTQGFFDIPVDTLRASHTLLYEFIERNKDYNDFVVVAPDYGSVKKARDIAIHLDLDLAIVDKRRPKPNVVEISNILGDVANKNCLIVDDMIDTAGTIISTAKLLHEKKAKKISIIATHGVFSNGALEKISQCMKDKIIDDLYIADTIPSNLKNISNKHIIIVSLVEFLSDVIFAYINNKSVSDVYSKNWSTLLKEWKKNI